MNTSELEAWVSRFPRLQRRSRELWQAIYQEFDEQGYPMTVCGLSSLQISLTTSNTLVISWPYPATGWSLEQSRDLSTTNWMTPPQAIANDGTNNFIIVGPPSGNLFFRLNP